MSLAHKEYRLTVGAIHREDKFERILELPFIKKHTVGGVILDCHQLSGDFEAKLDH